MRQELARAVITGRVWLAVKAYVEVTKPRSVALLTFTALGTMVVAGAYHPLSGTVLWQALAAVTLACAGANAISGYFDRDLDAIMGRTRHRPVPSGRISPPERALYWGLSLFLVSLGLAWSLNLLAWWLLWAGLVGYIGVYSLWLKRRSVWNILLGGVSGGMPALFGWAAVAGSLGILPLLVTGLVISWIPNHIWSLALFYREDYARAQVPMLPVVCETKKTLRYLLLSVGAMVGLSVLIALVGPWGVIYLATALSLGAVALLLSLHVYRHPRVEKAWLLFKFSSPYLALLFFGMMLDVWLG
jgi:protoheme IX farnesyltransferase